MHTEYLYMKYMYNRAIKLYVCNTVNAMDTLVYIMVVKYMLKKKKFIHEL